MWSFQLHATGLRIQMQENCTVAVNVQQCILMWTPYSNSHASDNAWCRIYLWFSLNILYANDHVLKGGTEELLVKKINKWKAGMLEKGLQVNIGKTKVMRCKNGVRQVENTEKFPCGICKNGVAMHATHAYVRNVAVLDRGRLQGVSCCYLCKKCVDGEYGQSEVLRETSLGLGKRLECIGKFCYWSATIAGCIQTPEWRLFG